MKIQEMKKIRKQTKGRSTGRPVWTGTGPKTKTGNEQDRGPDRLCTVQSGPVQAGLRYGPGADRAMNTPNHVYA